MVDVGPNFVQDYVTSLIDDPFNGSCNCADDFIKLCNMFSQPPGY